MGPEKREKSTANSEIIANIDNKRFHVYVRECTADNRSMHNGNSCAHCIIAFQEVLEQNHLSVRSFGATDDNDEYEFKF